MKLNYLIAVSSFFDKIPQHPHVLVSS